MDRESRLAAFALVLGVAFTLVLHSMVPGEVFISGDAGVKALMMRQMARGVWSADLRLEAPPWVHALWNAGLYPLTPPHVETLHGQRYIQWPLAFPALTAPAYRAGGYRAALLIPLLSTWGIWAAFAVTMRRLGVPRLAATAGLAGLAFATYLTYYSAVYWEHTVAVALAFAGAVLVLAVPAPAIWRAALGGSLAGLAVWFREELSLIAGTIAVAAVWRAWGGRAGGRRSDRAAAACVAGLAAPPLLLLVWNHALYGSIWGVHVLSVGRWLEEDPDATGPRQAWIVLKAFIIHNPLALLSPLAWLPASRARRPAAAWFVFAGLIFLIGLLLLAPFQGGRQWGPRYLLPAVPFLAVGVAVVFEEIAARRGLVRAIGLVAAAALFSWGAWMGTWRTAQELRSAYTRRYESLNGVMADPASIVAVSHPFITQQLVAAMPAKPLFLAPEAAQLELLGDGLFDLGVERFLYLCYPAYPCGPLKTGEVESVRLVGRKGTAIELTRRTTMGRYLAYDARLQRFDFSIGGRIDLGTEDSTILLGRGWSPIRRRTGEVPFRWALSPESCIQVPLGGPVGLAVSVRVRGLGSRRPQSLVVRANGGPVGRAPVGPRWREVNFAVPAEHLAGGANAICFDFGGGGEERETAVGAVAWVELRPR